MICPVDLVQMHQFNKIGGGVSTDDLYETWEIKECPACGRKVEEKYTVKILTDEEVKILEEK